MDSSLENNVGSFDPQQEDDPKVKKGELVGIRSSPYMYIKHHWHLEEVLSGDIILISRGKSRNSDLWRSMEPGPDSQFSH